MNIESLAQSVSLHPRHFLELIEDLDELKQVNKKTKVSMVNNGYSVYISIQEPNDFSKKEERFVLKHKPGIKSQLWRVWKSFVGITDTANGWDLVKERVDSAFVTPQAYKSKEIRLQRYVLNTGYQLFDFVCGYDAQSDVLFVRSLKESEKFFNYN